MWTTSSLDLPVTPSSYTLESISVNIVQEIPYSLIQTSEQNIGSDMWGLSLDFPPIVDPNVARNVSNFQAKLNGVVNTFKFVIAQRDLIYEGNNDITIVSIQGDNRSNITISRKTSPDVRPEVFPGTYLRVKDQLLKVLRVSETKNNIDVFPGLRYSGTLLNEPVYYKVNDVYGVFRQKQSTGQHTFNTNHTYNFKLEAIESTVI